MPSDAWEDVEADAGDAVTAASDVATHASDRAEPAVDATSSASDATSGTSARDAGNGRGAVSDASPAGGAEGAGEPEYDQVTEASLNGIYVKAQEMDRGHNVEPAPDMLPPGVADDARPGRDGASAHASDAEAHASDAESHASD